MRRQLKELEDRTRKTGLVIAGITPLIEQDGFDKGLKSIALLSPDPRTFWPVFSNSEHALDGKSDPIDRWSRKTILHVAAEVGGAAVFPFEGPPYQPFSTWAQRAGVAWQSPSGLLVHAEYGLWISFRGAVALEEAVDAVLIATSPCEPCSRPCLQSCPVNALTSGAYEYNSCLEHVRSDAGSPCARHGCIARRACPIGQDHAPPPQQAEAHMRAFAGAKATR